MNEAINIGSLKFEVTKYFSCMQRVPSHYKTLSRQKLVKNIHNDTAEITVGCETSKSCSLHTLKADKLTKASL